MKLSQSKAKFKPLEQSASNYRKRDRHWLANSDGTGSTTSLINEAPKKQKEEGPDSRKNRISNENERKTKLTSNRHETDIKRTTKNGYQTDTKEPVIEQQVKTELKSMQRPNRGIDKIVTDSKRISNGYQTDTKEPVIKQKVNTELKSMQGPSRGTDKIITDSKRTSNGYQTDTKEPVIKQKVNTELKSMQGPSRGTDKIITDTKRTSNGYQTDTKEPVIKQKVNTELKSMQGPSRGIDKIITDTKETPNRYQTDTKQTSNGHQIDTKETPNRHQRDTTTDTNWSPNGHQTDTITLDLDTLIGKEKSLIDLCFSECKRAGSLSTPKMTSELVRNHLQISTTRAKGLISRLIKKGIIYRFASKTGRGGWVKFGLPERVYKELLYKDNSMKQIPISYQTDTKQIPQRIPQRIPEIPSSSSKPIEASSTTRLLLENEWAEVCIPDALIKNRISKSIIFQCRDRNLLSAKELQSSLDAFAFDIISNDILTKKNVMSPQAWFMSSITKNRGYAPAANFLSDEEKAEIEMLERLEAKDNEKRARRTKIFELSFKGWFEGLSDKEKQELKPPFANTINGPIFETALREHFLNKIYNIEEVVV